MVAFFVFVVIFSASPESAFSAGSSAGRFVYPRLLQARGTNGEKLLHIQDGLILNLEKTSVLAENFILSTFEGGNQIDTLMNGKELEKNVYHDRNQAASVSVEEKEGTIEVVLALQISDRALCGSVVELLAFRGALSPKLRIAPSPLMARSEDGQIAHEIFDIKQPGDFKSDYIGRPYRVEDFRDALTRAGLLADVVSLGSYQMNHVWLTTFKSNESKKKLVDAQELVVKDRRCIVIDPNGQNVRLKVHWLPHHVSDDEAGPRSALGAIALAIFGVSAESPSVASAVGSATRPNSACGLMRRSQGLREGERIRLSS
ncbi:venom metalloproteinase antarease-like TtrivMP_A [Ixodes scapularis]